MGLPSGARIGVFTIISKLGEGGMGEVYRARDTKLEREVALKVLPELFTSDPERLARLEREARVLASLNHPNIAQVYGFEGTAIAMEFVDGQTLAEVIAGTGSAPAGASNHSRGLPVHQAFGIARQIATALEVAHDQGIVHRDLKPANIKVREDGTVKVLDFGLAKAFASDAETAAGAVSNSPTLTARATQVGVILGTAAYMAPEQAKGRTVDRRADVWAFGAVCFEMLSGRRAFDGDDVSEVLASVLKSEPEWSALPADLPAPVVRLLRRCLEKDPKRRLRDVAEGIVQMDEALAGSTASSSAPAAAAGAIVAAPFWRRAIPFVITALVTAASLLAVNALRRQPPAAPGSPIRFQHDPGSTPIYISTLYQDLAISPDGLSIVYSATNGARPPALWIRRLDQLEAAPLRGAEGATNPVISSDGAWVAYFNFSNPTQLSKVSILGGPPVPVARFKSSFAGVAWTSDGSIVLGAQGNPLLIVSEGGGEPVPLTALDTNARETDHLWPAAVPGTSVVLFTIATQGNNAATTGHLAAVDRASGRAVRLKIAGFQPRYLSSGHICYASSDGSLRVIAFDPKTLTVSGNPVPILEGVGVKTSGAADYDVSAGGRLVYTTGGALTLAVRAVLWTDRAGKEAPIAAPARNYFYARLSPDGTRVSLDIRDEEQDVWVWDLRRETLTRLTDKIGADQYGLWTPDSQRIVLNSPTAGRSELFVMRADGTGQMEQISDTVAQALPFPNAVTPDGKQVIFRAGVVQTRNDLFVVGLAGERTPRTVLATDHDERNATLSPDGKWMAYESDVSGRYEVYVRPFPDVNGGLWPLSTAGGNKPLWSPAGGEIFYLSADNKMMSVPVATMRGFSAGKPVMLFDAATYFFGGIGRNYDVTSDGKRFVMIKNKDSAATRSLPITVVLDWLSDVRARLK